MYFKKRLSRGKEWGKAKRNCLEDILSILELSYDHNNENEEEKITGVCFSSALNQMCLNKPSAGGIIYLDQQKIHQPQEWEAAEPF